MRTQLAFGKHDFSSQCARPYDGNTHRPRGKLRRGYRFEKDKFAIAGLTPKSSESVRPPWIKECPVQMEAEYCGEHKILTHILGEEQGLPLAIEVRVLKTYVVDELRLEGFANRIDPDKCSPMIMNFQYLYGLMGGKRADSTLASIDEELYRMPEQKSVGGWV